MKIGRPATCRRSRVMHSTLRGHYRSRRVPMLEPGIGKCSILRRGKLSSRAMPVRPGWRLRSGGRRTIIRQTDGSRSTSSALRSYLERNYAQQPLMNKIGLLWASGSMRGVLTARGKARLACGAPR